MLRKLEEVVETGWSWLRIGFGFHNMRGISWLAAKTGQLLKKDSAPWSK
jgi:hypothetical protein